MADDSGSSLFTTSAIASSGMQAENARMKVIAENIANANNTPSVPGGKPYQRQIITFKSEFDKALGAYKVKAGNVRNDNTDFVKKYDPSNPGADSTGYVLTPNVNPLIEMMDMSDAQHAYQANIGVLEAARTMMTKTIGIIQ
jgi:flagellar basal-body rod protein FlgC